MFKSNEGFFEQGKPPNKACTGRLVGPAKKEVQANSFSVSELFSPQPPVTQTVGRPNDRGTQHNTLAQPINSETRFKVMDISTATKLLVGFLISFYLIFNGWMALNENRIYIPFNIKIGLWFAQKIYGNEFAQREQDKFIKNQLSQGKQMIIVGVIVLLISFFTVLRF